MTTRDMGETPRRGTHTRRQWRLILVRIGLMHDANHRTESWIEPGCRLGGAYLGTKSSRGLLIGAVAVTTGARPEHVAHQTRQQYWPKNVSGTASSGKTFATGWRIGIREAVWRPGRWTSESLQPKAGMRLATISYERSRNGMSTGFADPATTETAAYSVETVKPMIKRAALGLDWKNDVPSLQELLATVAGWTNGDTGPITASATNDNDTLRVEQLEVREGSETARKVDEYLRGRPATARPQ